MTEAGENAKTKGDTANEIDGEQFAIHAPKDRANKKGELINEYYQALDRGEWARYYDIIAEKGWLLSDVGDVAAVVIGNKLIISQRKQITNNTSDFQVIDAYEFAGDDSNIIEAIADEIELGGEYDTERIWEVISAFYKQHGKNALFARYDRTKRSFVDESSHSSNGERAAAGGRLDGAKSPRKGVLERTPKTVQATVQGSLRDGTVTEEVQHSISEKSSDGQKLTKAQSRFFRNSKVRDEKGRLLAVYHGTKRAGFTALNKNKRSFAKKVFF